MYIFAVTTEKEARRIQSVAASPLGHEMSLNVEPLTLSSWIKTL